jgi:hypothetical protein
LSFANRDSRYEREQIRNHELKVSPDADEQRL